MLVVICRSFNDADAEGHLYEVFPEVELSASIMVAVDGNDSFPSLRIFSWSPNFVALRKRKVSLSLILTNYVAWTSDSSFGILIDDSR